MEVDEDTAVNCKYCGTLSTLGKVQSHLQSCSQRESLRLKRKGLLAKYFDMPLELLDSFDPLPPSLVPERASHVIHNLWIGGKGASVDVDWLCAQGITAVLNCAAELVPDERVVGVYKEFGIDWMHLPDCWDLPGSTIDFQACNRFLRKHRDAAVLVHCNLGQSRSPTIVIASLIEIHGYSLRDAWLLVKRKRPFVLPSPDFFCSLMKYEEEILKLDVSSIPVDILSLHSSVLL